MELLKCIICPKQPFFSDVSHLLTHISSKGHLSHLHKLQVRSHQEVEAGCCLASYNQWYQQYGIANLLSERMQQKEAKQANKRAAHIRRAAVAEEDKKALQPIINSNILNIHRGATLPVMVNPKQASKSTLKNRRRIMQEEMDDPDYIPTASGYGSGSVVPSQLATESHISMYPDLPGPHEFEGLDHLRPVTPECSKLKGTIWPGMTMFDAATEELQRKRNQKKDGSVLRNMQANSALVEPMEATYSPGGTMKRKRHMNELECETDLVEGETPIKRPSAQRKKKSPRKINRGTTRRYTRRSKTHRKTQSTESRNSTTTYGSTDTTSTFSESKRSDVHSQASSIESEEFALKITKPVAKPRKPKTEFSVFTDDALHMSALESLPNPFLEASQYFKQPVSAELSLQSTSWLQPQSFDSPEFNPFKDYRVMRTYNTQLRDVGTDKENENPLFWKHEDTIAHETSPVYTVDGNMDEFEANFGPLYSFTRNPLVDDFFHQGNNQNTVQNLR